MDTAKEILDAIEIIVDRKMQNVAQIYRGIVKAVSTNDNLAVVLVNGEVHNMRYYGSAPTVNIAYPVFVPHGNMSTAFVIVSGMTGGTGESGVSSVNGKTGNVILNANDVGALSTSTIIPSKTSQLDNDSGFINDSALSEYAKTSEIPTQTSQLTNDSGYITNAALNGYAKTNDIPTKVSQLNNDSGYVDSTGAKNAAPVQSVDGSTGAVVTNAVKTTTQTLTDVQKAQARANIGAGISSFSGSYNDLSDKPAIPTKTSDLNNDSGFIDSSDVPVKSVNSKTGNVVLTATDVGAVSTSDVTTTLGTSTTKVPSEKAVSDALSGAGAGDMLKSVYDPNSAVETAGGIPNYVKSNAVAKKGDTMTGTLTVGSASLQTNGHVTGTWLKTTANIALSTKPTQIAVINDGWVYSRTPAQIKDDIGLSNIDNVKQYSASNPPPYPVTSVNGQTGDITINAGTKTVTSASQPTDMNVGDFWYQEI